MIGKKIFFLLLFLSPFFSSFTITKENVPAENYLNLATIFKESMEYEKAISILEYISPEESNIEIKKMLGKLYYLKGYLNRALEIFKNLREDDWFVLLYRGLIYEDLNRRELAIKNYLGSLRLRKTTIALHRLGKIYYYAKNYREAIRFFSELIHFDASVRIAYYYLGESYLQETNFKKAYYYLSKARNFYPNAVEIKERVVLVKNKLGKKFFQDRKEKIEQERKIVKLPLYREEKGIQKVRVGIGRKLTRFTFRSGKGFIISDFHKTFRGRPDKFYTFVLEADNLLLYDYGEGIVYEKFSSPVEVKSSGSPFYILNVTYGKRDFWEKTIDRAYRGNLRIVLTKDGLTLVNILSLEEYLYGVLPSEIPPSVNFEALKAQAVAGRTVAYRNLGRHAKEGFDFCPDVHCQVYQGISVEKEETNRAVRETRGEILLYSNQPIEAFYHSNCGGCLRGDTFGRREYLISKFDSLKLSPERNSYELSPYDEEMWFLSEPEELCSTERSDFRWQRIYDSEDFFLSFGFPLKDLKNIIPLNKGDCFHYDTVKVVTSQKELTIEGDLKIRNFFDKLRSSAFKLEIKFSPAGKPELIFFWGAGFGHATGLCQRGAVNMADKGFNYKEILSHYYPGTDIGKIY
jgi:SpoIID/LytB domain protein